MRTRRRKAIKFLIIFITTIVALKLFVTNKRSNVLDSLISIETHQFSASNNKTFDILGEKHLRTCSESRKHSKLNTESDDWQVLETSKASFKLFNAYYDERNIFKQRNKSHVKILFYVEVTRPRIRTFCQLWFDGHDKPIVSEVSEYHDLWPKTWEKMTKGSKAYFALCQNPLGMEGIVPSSVSLVENECDESTNHLKVYHNLPRTGVKKMVVVCARLYYFKDDLTRNLIEWIEIQVALGAGKIIFHIIDVHHNVLKALKFYEATGVVEIQTILFPEEVRNTEQNNMQRILNQMIALNDCFYKNLYEFQFVAPMDTDEIIVPARPEDKTFDDLLNRVIEKRKLKNFNISPVYIVLPVYFHFDNNDNKEVEPEVSRDFLFLHHVYRSKLIGTINQGSKSFHNTEEVEVVYNHYSHTCLSHYPCKQQEIDYKDATLHHYRKGCNRHFYSDMVCDQMRKNTVRDVSIWKYKHEVILNVNRTLEALGMDFER